MPMIQSVPRRARERNVHQVDTLSSARRRRAYLQERSTMTTRFLAAPALLLAACTSIHTAAHDESIPAPRYAAHQHLISPAFTKIINQPELDGAALLALLDKAGIERGVVLSMGYSFSDERKHDKVADPDRATRDENDWTS